MSNRRIVTILLVCSLAINLLLVGGVVGHLMAGPPRGGPGPMPHLGWIIRSLDEGRRESLRDDFREHVRASRPLRREVREAQQQFEATLGDPNMDPAELAEALDRIRDASLAYQEATHSEMARVLGLLEPEERARAAKFLTRRHRDDGPPHGDRREPPPP